MDHVRKEDLYEWCRIPFDQLQSHPDLKVPFRMVRDSEEMGQLMAAELVALITRHNAVGQATRAIIPCGPSCWYEPWTELVNRDQVDLRNLTVFHMDECFDWQCRPLPRAHPYNFRSFMETHFYGGIDSARNVPEDQRFWPCPETINTIIRAVDEGPIDITVGGWGQDGHIAYNQARRHPYSRVTIEEVADCRTRVQENNWDTILALANRSFGSAYQFVPPMSVTLGVKECMSADRVRVFSDTGAWKQTALRVALFSDPVPEYPMTLLQTHPDALITATVDTARHPISEHPEWELI